jgi:hypothetical protein
MKKKLLTLVFIALSISTQWSFTAFDNSFDYFDNSLSVDPSNHQNRLKKERSAKKILVKKEANKVVRDSKLANQAAKAQEQKEKKARLERRKEKEDQESAHKAARKEQEQKNKKAQEAKRKQEAERRAKKEAAEKEQRREESKKQRAVLRSSNRPLPETSFAKKHKFEIKSSNCEDTFKRHKKSFKSNKSDIKGVGNQLVRKRKNVKPMFSFSNLFTSNKKKSPKKLKVVKSWIWNRPARLNYDKTFGQAYGFYQLEGRLKVVRKAEPKRSLITSKKKTQITKKRVKRSRKDRRSVLTNLVSGIEATVARAFEPSRKVVKPKRVKSPKKVEQVKKVVKKKKPTKAPKVKLVKPCKKPTHKKQSKKVVKPKRVKAAKRVKKGSRGRLTNLVDEIEAAVVRDFEPIVKVKKVVKKKQPAKDPQEYIRKKRINVPSSRVKKEVAPKQVVKKKKVVKKKITKTVVEDKEKRRRLTN